MIIHKCGECRYFIKIDNGPKDPFLEQYGFVYGKCYKHTTKSGRPRGLFNIRPACRRFFAKILPKTINYFIIHGNFK